MLIGEVLQKVPMTESWQMAANKLADTVRNLWLANKSAGYREWEESFSETQVQVEKLREEGFRDVYEIEYVFKWWGNDRDMDALAGEIDVIWKLQKGDSAVFYQTFCRVADRDFVVGIYGTEAKKRAAFRAEFRQAFETWRGLLQEL